MKHLNNNPDDPATCDLDEFPNRAGQRTRAAQGVAKSALLAPVLLAMFAGGGCVVSDEVSEDEVGQANQAVLNGQFQPATQHPWIVNDGGRCHGVLIHPQWVLTAAHCVDGTLGLTARWSAGDQAARGGRPYKHLDHNAYNDHDIALVRLSTPFTITARVQTIGLPSSPVVQGDEGVLASTIDHDRNALAAGQVSVYSGVVEPRTSTGNTFRTSTDGSAGCRGDSGSGLVDKVETRVAISNTPASYRARVLGIASKTTGCSVGRVVIWTEVFAYKQWISNTINMSESRLTGDVTLGWIGVASPGAVAHLQCYRREPDWPTWAPLPTNVRYDTSFVSAIAPMDVKGAQVGVPCANGYRVDRIIWVSCNTEDPAHEVRAIFTTDTRGYRRRIEVGEDVGFLEERRIGGRLYVGGIYQYPVAQVECEIQPASPIQDHQDNPTDVSTPGADSSTSTSTTYTQNSWRR